MTYTTRTSPLHYIYIALVIALVLITIYGCPSQIALAQTIPATELRLTPRTTPAPLTGRYRFYVDPADGVFKCLTPSGTSCMSSTTSITIGATTTGAVGTSASVSNSGTSTAPILNFTIPVGATGATGPTGQGFNFRGAWVASTVYNAFDIVTNGGNTYEADHTFTSTGSFNAANWNLWASAGGGGGSGTVTTFTTTTWPSWLTPSVTNATTTPNLDVSGGTVPIANGGTGATTAPTALTALGAEGTANKNVASGYAGLDANKVLTGTPGLLQSTNATTTINTCTAACNFLTNFAYNAGGVTQFHANQVVELIYAGVLSDTGTPTLSFKFVVDGIVTLLTGPTITLPSGVANVGWNCDINLMVTAVGANYTFETQGYCNASGITMNMSATAPVTTVSATTAGALRLQPVWSVSSASNTLTTRQQIVKSLN